MVYSGVVDYTKQYRKVRKNCIFAGIMKSNYQKTGPTQVFTVRVDRELVQESLSKGYYRYSYTMAVAPTNNSFIDLFAGLVSKHGKRYQKDGYAAMLGVTGLQLNVILQGLTGASFTDWVDACLQPLCKGLLRDTDWPVTKIAEIGGFTSSTVFCRYFQRLYKCSPMDWRERSRAAKTG